MKKNILTHDLYLGGDQSRFDDDHPYHFDHDDRCAGSTNVVSETENVNAFGCSLRGPYRDDGVNHRHDAGHDGLRLLSGVAFPYLAEPSRGFPIKSKINLITGCSIGIDLTNHYRNFIDC